MRPGHWLTLYIQRCEIRETHGSAVFQNALTVKLRRVLPKWEKSQKLLEKKT
jgi:hypothetical protein